MKTVNEKAPWHFRLSKWMIRNQIRGGYYLLDLADRFGWLNKVVCYQLDDQLKMYVPLYRAANRWDRNNIFEYDPPTVASLATAINGLDSQAVFVDCGADIGVMTMLVAMQTSNISQYIAIEPNIEAYQILEKNYNALPVTHKTMNGAVGEFTGSGKLVDSEFYPGDDHARYIVQDENGEIPVYRIDDLSIEKGRPVVLKLDVEGAEKGAVEGAVNTLAASSQFVVDIEAHPKVAQRTGIDPIEILRRLNEIKPCSFKICECPDVELDLGYGFFEQLGHSQVKNYDVIVSSI